MADSPAQDGKDDQLIAVLSEKGALDAILWFLRRRWAEVKFADKFSVENLNELSPVENFASEQHSDGYYRVTKFTFGENYYELKETYPTRVHKFSIFQNGKQVFFAIDELENSENAGSTKKIPESATKIVLGDWVEDLPAIESSERTIIGQLREPDGRVSKIDSAIDSNSKPELDPPWGKAQESSFRDDPSSIDQKLHGNLTSNSNFQIATDDIPMNGTINPTSNYDVLQLDSSQEVSQEKHIAPVTIDPTLNDNVLQLDGSQEVLREKRKPAVAVDRHVMTGNHESNSAKAAKSIQAEKKPSLQRASHKPETVYDSRTGTMIRGKQVKKIQGYTAFKTNSGKYFIVSPTGYVEEQDLQSLSAVEKRIGILSDRSNKGNIFESESNKTSDLGIKVEPSHRLGDSTENTHLRDESNRTFIGKIIWLFLSPEGRISRITYWTAMFTAVIIFSFANVVVGGLSVKSGVGGGESALNEGPFYYISFLMLAWSQIMLVVKRCHDRNKGGAIGVILALLPGIGFFWIVVLGLLPGTKRENQFGSPSK
jgi:uncharacterized membrane protein YhaH (DUF805 family)